jgi:hypothetical protein
MYNIQIVHIVEENIENYHPEKTEAEVEVDSGFSRRENFQYFPQLHELFILSY